MSVLPVGMAGAALWPTNDATLGAGEAGLTAPTAPTAPTPAAGSGGIGGTEGATGASDGFAGLLGNAIDSLNATQASADNLATQAATGSLTNVADYMLTAEEANIQTQLTAAVRNNALQAFQTIMGMQL